MPDVAYFYFLEIFIKRKIKKTTKKAREINPNIIINHSKKSSNIGSLVALYNTRDIKKQIAKKINLLVAKLNFFSVKIFFLEVFLEVLLDFFFFTLFFFILNLFLFNFLPA
jgi:hypothetical protein